MLACEICNKEFKTKLGLSGHSRMHGPSNGKTTHKKKTCPHTGIVYAEHNETSHFASLKNCQHCNNLFKPNKGTEGKYCSRKCSGVVNGGRNGEQKPETKDKIRKSLLERSKNISMLNCEEVKMTPRKKLHRVIPKSCIVGDFSKVFINRCVHCNISFCNRSSLRYCNKHSNLYKSGNRNKYAFTFNVFDYPDLFDLELVKEKGWHSHGGRFDKNLDGITRDHRISVNEAIKNDYDAFYIRHPLNCELMSFSQNNKKKTKSSISYSKLKKLVDEYEQNKKG